MSSSGLVPRALLEARRERVLALEHAVPDLELARAALQVAAPLGAPVSRGHEGLLRIVVRWMENRSSRTC